MKSINVEHSRTMNKFLKECSHNLFIVKKDGDSVSSPHFTLNLANPKCAYLSICSSKLVLTDTIYNLLQAIFASVKLYSSAINITMSVSN